MEHRYVVVGLNVVLVSAIFIIYGLITGSDITLGVSLSTLVLGAVFLTVGFSAGEPINELLKTFTLDAEGWINVILEDSGLASKHSFTACLEDSNSVLLVMSSEPMDCSEAHPGMGMIKDTAFIAFPFKSTALLTELSIGKENLRENLASLLVNKLSICESVSITTDKDTLIVELANLTGEAIETMKSIINPVKAIMLATVARTLGTSIEVVSEHLIERDYTIKLRVKK